MKRLGLELLCVEVPERKEAKCYSIGKRLSK